MKVEDKLLVFFIYVEFCNNDEGNEVYKVFNKEAWEELKIEVGLIDIMSDIIVVVSLFPLHFFSSPSNIKPSLQVIQCALLLDKHKEQISFISILQSLIIFFSILILK